MAAIFFLDPTSNAPLLRRVMISFANNVPLLRQASRNTARHVVHWTRRGSALRALLVISVGTITLLALTGLLVFVLFFLAATFNAIVISLLMFLAVVGGYLALFFACITAICIEALSRPRTTYGTIC
ncbi:uncharacterized protein LOC117930008 [Vitis riparia]|uniref:uncharacterized protein LOC117930008 n=1 Tax=Vitis riparia TaxID=96939 RepID=UPI00155B1C15|nr:uncharacterized protein LOC117930008 [Vitis riparia]